MNPTRWLLKVLVEFYRRGLEALESGATLPAIRSLEVVSRISKARMTIPDDSPGDFDQLDKDLQQQFEGMVASPTRSVGVG